MGLDLSHCSARWSYGGFNIFRRKLSQQVGFDLYEMAGFEMMEFLEKSRRGEIEAREAMELARKAPRGKEWDTLSNADDPIIPLLNHSDCDGKLSAEECAAVAPRLRELVADWDDNDYNKINALQLADGMELAAERGEPLEFC